MGKPIYSVDKNNKILKDGHTMFAEDVIKDIKVLNRVIKELREALEKIATKHNILRFLAYGQIAPDDEPKNICQCDLEVGHLCESCAVKDILKIAEQALKGEEDE